MTLREAATTNRVPLVHRAGDGSDRGSERVQGKNGHLYQEGTKLTLVFCDEDRKRPFTGKSRVKATKLLHGYTIAMTQDGDQEFIATLPWDAFPAALRVIDARHFRSTKGVSRPFPPPKETL